MKCPQCNVACIERDTEEGPSTAGKTAHVSKWSKGTGDGRRIKFTSWVCPSCHRTKGIRSS